MKVWFPERIVDRHVGGNTTYGRHLRSGLMERGVEVGVIPAGSRAATTALRETSFGRARRAEGEILHFLADTGPLLAPRTPSVVTVHGVASRWIRTARTPMQEQIWRLRVSRAIAGCDRIITVSESSRRDVSAVFDVAPERITVIHHGIDVPVEPRIPMSPAVSAKLPAEYLLYLGNIEPRKNLVALVRAMEDPAVRDLGLRLVIAGRPAWNAEESMASIAASPYVDHLGFVSDEDRHHVMAGARALVFPSLYEGFGFPVLEALAVGTPVICSNAGSLADVAGPAWRLADTSPRGVASGLVAAVQDSEWMSRVTAEGPAWASTFGWDRSVEQHLALYEGLVTP